MAEEELRRRPPPKIYNANEADLFKIFCEVLEFDEKAFVLPTVEALQQQLKSGHEERVQRVTAFYEKKIEDLGNGLPVVLADGAETIQDCLAFTPDIRIEIAKLEASGKGTKSFEGKIENITAPAQALIKKFEKRFQKFVVPLLMMGPLFSGPSASPLPPNIITFGKGDHHIVLAMILQNSSHVKNADRRQAIESGKYLDPFTNSQKILKSIHDNLAQTIKEKHAREILGTTSLEISSLVIRYVTKFNKFFGDKQEKWNIDCIELYYLLQPYKRVFHSEPDCGDCRHKKSEWAGFRCGCGCMNCFTSYYFDQKQ